MNRSFAAVLVLALAACGGAESDLEDFRDAAPSRQGIDIRAPQAQALTASGDYARLEQPLLGQLAPFYVLTRDITWTVNAGVAWVLHLCEEIVENEPTSFDGDQAVWGPHTPMLSPDTFRFTVTRNGDAFDYVFEAKPKSAPDSDYVALIRGSHTPSGKKLGKGTFTIDWEAGHRLGRRPDAVGSADIAYDRPSLGEVRVQVDFDQVYDQKTQGRTDARYAFERKPTGGSFEFVIPEKDLQDNGSLPERLAIKSRWIPSGAGRCDVAASGGDLKGARVAVTECWDENFGRVFFGDSLGFLPTEGSEQSCAFSEAEYTDL